MKTLSDSYEDDYVEKLSYDAICRSCGIIHIQPENIWFDEQGYGYSTKLTKCPHCGKIIILGYIEDYGLDVNIDERFYRY